MIFGVDSPSPGLSVSLYIGRIIPEAAPAHIVNAIQSISVTQSAEGRSGFQIAFAAARPTGFSFDYPLVDDPLLAGYNRVIVVATISGTPSILIDGIITNRQLMPGDGPNGTVFAVTGEDVSVMMDLDEQSREHPACSFEMIALELIMKYAPYGLVPMIIPSVFLMFDLPIERTKVQTLTDLRYITRLANMVGWTFYVEPGPIFKTSLAYWGPPIRITKPQKAITVDMGFHTNAQGVQFQYVPTVTKVMTGQIQDLDTGFSVPLLLGSLAAAGLSALSGGGMTHLPRTEVFNSAGMDSTQSMAAATSMTQRSSEKMVVASGTLDTVRYGTILNARGLVGMRGTGSQHDGTYFVHSVSHSITRGSYTQQFQLTRDSIGSVIPWVHVG